jgi:hypothetical protein
MDSAALPIMQGMVQYELCTVVSRSIAGKAGRDRGMTFIETASSLLPIENSPLVKMCDTSVSTDSWAMYHAAVDSYVKWILAARRFGPCASVADPGGSASSEGAVGTLM